MRFEQNVWELTKKIPKGKVTTYGIIASKLKTKACRAVGNALNKNRNSAVPCHRVVRSDGLVGGFARGTKNKISILKKEGVRINNKRVMEFDKFLFRF